jgi:hypothetical protein
MEKKKFSKGLIIGIIIGVVVAVGALYYWDRYQRKTKLERNVEKFQKDAQKELEKAKKIFE